MKKTIFLISLLVISIFLSGCEGSTLIPSSKKESGILDIELYDKDGNLIGTSPTMAIVNTIPDVEFINIKSTMRNTGNIGLMAKLQIFAPTAPIILTKFRDNNQICYEIHTDYVICASPKALIEGQQISLQSGLVNVNEIGIGTHKLLAKATAQYTENGETKYISSEKGFVLTIEKDPIRAGISVDIGTSGITSPPPCRKICPDGMILEVETCIMKPIITDGNIICELGTYNAQTGYCMIEPQIICPVG